MILLDILLLLVILYTLYIVSIGAFGLHYRPTDGTHRPQKRFRIIIPAHNEEKVIGQLLDSIARMRYPANLYDVVVIADNCTDETARAADQPGVKVLQRTNDKERGKGHALKWAFAQLGFTGTKVSKRYDAAVVFDADNLAEPNFLAVMNARLLRGEHLIQCFLDSKNPTDTWISGAYSILFWLNNRFIMLSRYNLSLSAVFMGTGMCISSEVLRKVGWNTVTLTEDLEYSIQALLFGYRTTYTHETRVYDEKPLTFLASCTQRLRWARGQFNVLFRFIRPLSRRALADRCPVKAEAALRLCQLMVLLSTPVIMILYQFLNADGFASTLLAQIPVLTVALAYFPYAVMAALFYLDNLTTGVLKYVLFYPIFTFSWLVLLVAGLFSFRQKAWLPTEHTRALKMADVEEVPLERALAAERKVRIIRQRRNSNQLISAPNQLVDF